VPLSEVLSAVTQAWALLIAHPAQWLFVVATFLVAVEALMFIPYVGFVVKLAVAGVVSAGIFALFASASGGNSPNSLTLISSFSLPWAMQATLAFATILPFAVGVLYLYLKGGPASIHFFFGNILKAKPPARELFVQFKYVMLAVALPLTLMPGVVILSGLSGVAAVLAALAAATVNWLPLLLIGTMTFAFEWVSAYLPALMPKAAAVAITGLLLLAFLAWSFAINYTVSTRALGVHSSANAA